MDWLLSALAAADPALSLSTGKTAQPAHRPASATLNPSILRREIRNSSFM